MNSRWGSDPAPARPGRHHLAEGAADGATTPSGGNSSRAPERRSPGIRRLRAGEPVGPAARAAQAESAGEAAPFVPPPVPWWEGPAIVGLLAVGLVGIVAFWAFASGWL